MKTLPLVFAAMRDETPYTVADLVQLSGCSETAVRRVLRLLYRLGVVSRRTDKNKTFWQTRQMDLPYL